MKSVMGKFVLAGLCLMLGAPAFAGEPRGAPVAEAERYALRCQGKAPHRGVWPQGTMLWRGVRLSSAFQTSAGRPTAGHNTS